MSKPFYQYEYEHVMREFRSKRKLLKRVLDQMDQDETGHDWPGLYWSETLQEVMFLATQLAVMRKAAEDRDQKLEGVKK